ncbi:MAG: ATP-dependent protease ATPase subunit HslU [Pseudomonadota bacterium]
MTTNESCLTPREIVGELDRHIVGQDDAKRAVAIALRNRWRRFQVEDDLRDEILPKNILMIGPTGVGKTEIARRLAKLTDAPFLKVEATKFTEVGYVGRDVEQIIRDLLENSISRMREVHSNTVKAKAEVKAEERVLDALVGENATTTTRESFREKLRKGELDEREIEITIQESRAKSMPTFDIPGAPGAQMGMINIGDMLGNALGRTPKTKKMTVAESYHVLLSEESQNLIDEEAIVQDAITRVEQHGIVFIDEIDKIVARGEGHGPDVSRHGVQRDLLPLIEGCQVTTRHGTVRTDHILFIASGAFHLAKPSDMLPELQGRLPVRVELKDLNKDDFYRILSEPRGNLIAQYQGLMKVEGVTLSFTDEALIEIATLASKINQLVENIGARRLHTVLERLLEDISFRASDLTGEAVEINVDDVREKIIPLTDNESLERFIL